MSSSDIFRQLTRGVRFTKPKPSTSFTDARKKESIENSKLENLDKILEFKNTENEDKESNFEFISSALAKELSDKTEKKIKKKSSKILSAEELAQQRREKEIQSIRQKHLITVYGKYIPAPLNNFEELSTLYGVDNRLLENIKACCYETPTPIQMQALPILLEGRSVLACAPTGSGKTLAFLLPILYNLGGPKKDGFRALVLAPTRELTQQIYRECVRLSEKTGLKIHIVGKVEDTQQKFNSASGRHCDIMISTPKGIVSLLEQQPSVLDLSSVKWFVMDEADRLLEAGDNFFKAQLEKILAACSNPKRILALFSATSTVPVTKWALRYLKHLIRVHIGFYNAATETVQQELMFVGSESGKLLAIRNLMRTGLTPPVLIFLQSKDRAKQLYDELMYDGVNVDIIHSERTQQQRENSVKFFREGKTWILICTELMARGIDFKGVNLVINYDFPPSTIAYIHRVGRTGRAGRRGRAITFFTHDDSPHLKSIAQIITNSGGKVPEFMLKLKAPTKAEKRKLAHSAPEREDISTKLPKLGKTRTIADSKAKKFTTKVKGKDNNKEDLNLKTNPTKSKQRKPFVRNKTS